MDTKAMLKKVEDVVSPVLSNLAYRLVDSEYINEHGRWILRLYVEREDGSMTIEDCQKVSRSIEGVLDVEDIVPYRYNLEVSSPGLDRPLRQQADFERFKGQAVRIKTKELINGRGNYFGQLNGIKDGEVSVTVDGMEYKIPVDAIAKARLNF